jgi:hypothetical protein
MPRTPPGVRAARHACAAGASGSRPARQGKRRRRAACLRLHPIPPPPSQSRPKSIPADAAAAACAGSQFQGGTREGAARHRPPVRHARQGCPACCLRAPATRTRYAAAQATCPLSAATEAPAAVWRRCAPAGTGSPKNVITLAPSGTPGGSVPFLTRRAAQKARGAGRRRVARGGCGVTRPDQTNWPGRECASTRQPARRPGSPLVTAHPESQGRAH